MMSLAVEGDLMAQLPNTDAQRSVNRRFWAATGLASLLTLFVGGAAIAELLHRPIANWLEFGLLSGFIGAIAGGLFGFGIGRNMVNLFVPVSISVDRGAVIGDFRGRHWPGPPSRAIRFQDLRHVGRTTVLRIPVIESVPGREAGVPWPTSQRFYLTELNLLRVQEAVRAWRGIPKGTS